MPCWWTILLALCLAGAAGGAPAGEPSDEATVERIAPRIELVTFPSSVLQGTKRFCVVLPEGYDPAKSDWPVLFLLHGRGRNERSLVDDPTARAALLGTPVVVVLPRGDDGWYVDSPVRPADRYQAYLEEVIALAERRYGLSHDPRRRAIAGWSMGGYGAVRFAEEHPGRFAAVASIIGLLDYPRDSASFGPGQRYPVRTGTFGADPEVWRRLNPIEHAERLRGAAVLLVSADEAFDRTMNERFERRLSELRIPHRFEMLKGGHTLEVVRQALPLVIRHAAEVLMKDRAAQVSPDSR